MKKLCMLVDVAVNNENCVVFKIKENALMDLISLGCFSGNEDMIRMTKGRTPDITVFNKDGSNYSYHFGEGSTTVISDNRAKQREMIRECAILDYGIVCDFSHEQPRYNYEKLIKDTLHIKSMDDAIRNISLVSGGGMSCNIRINEQTMTIDTNVKDVFDWFEQRGYVVEFENRDITMGLPCGRVYGSCCPIELPEIQIDLSTITRDKLSELEDKYGYINLYSSYLEAFKDIYDDYTRSEIIELFEDGSTMKEIVDSHPYLYSDGKMYLFCSEYLDDVLLELSQDPICSLNKSKTPTLSSVDSVIKIAEDVIKQNAPNYKTNNNIER